MSTSTEPTITTAGGVKVVKPTVQGHFRDYYGRVRGGDLGTLPAVLGLVILSLYFGLSRDTFFSAFNFANKPTRFRARGRKAFASSPK